MGVISNIQLSIENRGRMWLDGWLVGRVFYQGDEVHADIFSAAPAFIRTRKLTESEIAELSNQVTLRNRRQIV